MADFIMQPLVDLSTQETARLGAGTGAANNLSDADRGKAVKLVAESRYDLCAVGNEIEGLITSVEVYTANGFTIGTVQRDKRVRCTFDGLQATPGTGTVAVGDFVVTGTPVAKGTALTAPFRVCKATAAGNTLNHKWRVVSLGTAGTGAVGTQGLIEKV